MIYITEKNKLGKGQRMPGAILDGMISVLG